jgi:hypothetical protein
LRYWNTGDHVTDTNLGYFESIGQYWPDMSVEEFMDKVRAQIDITDMLPKAVLLHFKLPSPFIGAQPYDWSKERLDQRARELTAAITLGIENCAADPTLKLGGGADLSDRPRSEGERVLERLEAFDRHRGDAEFNALAACHVSGDLRAAIEELGRARQRKRPSGNLSPGDLVARAISNIRFHALRFNSVKSAG